MSTMRERIDQVLAEIRAKVDGARSMPMSSSVMVNRAELLELLDDLARVVEDTVSHASEVVDDRDAVMAQGRTAAEEIVRQAHADREKLVSDTDVYKLAQQRADELTDAAEREARELRAETDQYVEERLANFELNLERTLEAVKRGRARLTGGLSHALADDSDVEQIDLPAHLRRD